MPCPQSIPHPASPPVAPPPPQTDTSHRPASPRTPQPVSHRCARPQTARRQPPSLPADRLPNTLTKAWQHPPVDESCRSQPPTRTPPPRSQAASCGQPPRAARQRGGRPPASRPSLWSAVRAPLPAVSTGRPPMLRRRPSIRPASCLWAASRSIRIPARRSLQETLICSPAESVGHRPPARRQHPDSLTAGATSLISGHP